MHTKSTKIGFGFLTINDHYDEKQDLRKCRFLKVKFNASKNASATTNKYDHLTDINRQNVEMLTQIAWPFIIIQEIAYNIVLLSLAETSNVKSFVCCTNLLLHALLPPCDTFFNLLQKSDREDKFGTRTIYNKSPIYILLLCGNVWFLQCDVLPISVFYMLNNSSSVGFCILRVCDSL